LFPFCIVLLLLMVHNCFLVVLRGVRLHPFAMFYWCSSTFLYYVLLVLVNAPLLCSTVAYRHLLVVFCNSASMPPYYAMSVFIIASLLCWCSLTFPCYVLFMLVDISLLCSIGVHWCLLTMFYWCSLMPPCVMFVLFGFPN
jgi:hypothetical protein